MEATILAELDFDISRPVTYVFLEFLQEKLALEKKIFFFVRYLLEMTLLDVRCQKYKPLLMATSAVFLVRKIYKQGDWDVKLEQITELEEK
jgi:hypothetical protein